MGHAKPAQNARKQRSYLMGHVPFNNFFMSHCFQFKRKLNSDYLPLIRAALNAPFKCFALPAIPYVSTLSGVSGSVAHKRLNFS